jgi:16S rRNA (guanine527-N7)-methyltransferase
MSLNNKTSYIELAACTNVSRETLAKLKLFSEMVLEWNQFFNLVSRNIAVNEIWDTHIMECLHFGGIIRDYCSEVNYFAAGPSHLKDRNSADYAGRFMIYDVGSGAGFPGIILGAMGFECILVERNHKKTVFLKEVVRKLNINCTIINNDIRDIDAVLSENIIITSRAVTSINNLLTMCNNLITDSSALFLLKSSDQLSEMTEARKYWTFELKQYHNRYRKEGVILKLNKLMRVGNAKKGENNIDR